MKTDKPRFAHKALMGAYRKGQKAREEGKCLSDCPYIDKRTSDGSVTFSRAFIRAWKEGFLRKGETHA